MNEVKGIEANFRPGRAREPDERDYYVRLIDTKAAAKFLGLSHRSLEGLRVKGSGPKFCRLGTRVVRYRRKDLIAWSERHLRSNTAEALDVK